MAMCDVQMADGMNSVFVFFADGMVGTHKMGFSGPHQSPLSIHHALHDDHDNGDEANGDAIIKHVSSFVLDEEDTPPPSASELSDGVPSSPPATRSPTHIPSAYPQTPSSLQPLDPSATMASQLALMQAALQQQQLLAASVAMLPAWVGGMPGGMPFASAASAMMNPMYAAMYVNQAAQVQAQAQAVQLAQMQATAAAVVTAQAQAQQQAWGGLNLATGGVAPNANAFLNNNSHHTNSGGGTTTRGGHSSWTNTNSTLNQNENAVVRGLQHQGDESNGKMFGKNATHHNQHSHHHHNTFHHNPLHYAKRTTPPPASGSTEGTDSHDDDSFDDDGFDKSSMAVDGQPQGRSTEWIDGEGRANEICLAYLTSKCRFPRCRRAHVDVDIPEGVCPCWYLTGFCKFHRKCRLEHSGRPLHLCAPAQTKRMTQKDRKKAERVREHCGPIAKKNEPVTCIQNEPVTP